MKTINIKPNANGLTNIEDLTLAQLQVLKEALNDYEAKFDKLIRKDEKTRQNIHAWVFEVKMYFTKAARLVAQKELID